MKLQRIDDAVESCREHLDRSTAWGTEIEAYLTRYLLVLMCALFEEEIKRIAIDRSSRTGDSGLIAFVTSAVGQVFRSVRTSEIAGLLGRFGVEPKEKFQAEMQNAQRAETFFNNIVVNRHDTAHSSGANISFRDLVQFYEEGHVVLDVVKRSLSA